MKTILITVLILTLTTAQRDNLTGRWESLPSPKGNITGIVFKPDNSFDGYVNRKPFVSGTYTLQDSVFAFVDNGCDGKRGTYKIIFFGNNDSIRFQVMQDSCAERAAGMKQLVLGRVKRKQHGH